MDQSLFESLTGKFLNGTPVNSVSKNRKTIVSIMDHLYRMFNTRRGTISHLDDYGLPDVTEIYRKIPDGIDDLQHAIKKSVEKYEPRLCAIRIKYMETDEKIMKLVFILSGRLKNGGGRVNFQTTFNTYGRSTIAPFENR